MKNQENVIIKSNINYTTDNEPVHSIEFDGAYHEFIGAEITSKEAEIFKAAVYAERERIWDESADLVDMDIMLKILREEKKHCSKCKWEGYSYKLITESKPVYVDNEIIGYHTNCLCPSCGDIIIH